jgi:hypothetical protein
MLQTTPRYYGNRAQYECSTVDPADITLFSTVLLVVMLAASGAFFIMAVACFLGEDHDAGGRLRLSMPLSHD